MLKKVILYKHSVGLFLGALLFLPLVLRFQCSSFSRVQQLCSSVVVFASCCRRPSRHLKLLPDNFVGMSFGQTLCSPRQPLTFQSPRLFAMFFSCYLVTMCQFPNCLPYHVSPSRPSIHPCRRQGTHGPAPLSHASQDDSTLQCNCKTVRLPVFGYSLAVMVSSVVTICVKGV